MMALDETRTAAGEVAAADRTMVTATSWRTAGLHAPVGDNELH